MKALPVAVEQHHPQRSFELLDPRCDARGHPMQLAGSFDDASFIDNAFEYLKIDKVHRMLSILILRMICSTLFDIIEQQLRL
jgi:hypothetical protein